IKILFFYRWDQPEFTNEIIQGYTLQCFFIENLKEIQICDDKNITTTELEHTVHNLTFNATYYFRVRAHTKIVAGPYTDLISVSTTYENPVPKLLLKTYRGVLIWDVDLNRTNFVSFTDRKSVVYIAYCIQDNRIYWTNEDDLMTFKINENNITKIATLSLTFHINDLCIDWVARNLYLSYSSSDSYILKFDITMWENDIIKFDEIYKISNSHYYLSVSPFMGILYGMSYNWINEEYNMTKYYLDGRSEQIVQINSSFCLSSQNLTYSYAIDNTNNEEPLIYWLCKDRIFVTDINVSMSNTILHNPNAYNTTFRSITIDKTNIYIGAFNNLNQRIVYVFEKKFANLKSVSNSYKYFSEYIEKIYVSDKSLQPYPLMRCLTPDNFENVTATKNSIIINLPEPVVNSGCKKYNLPTTMYTIFVSCLDNNLNKSEKFNVQTFERYYEIQNLTPFTEYKLKFTLSNFYFDQLSINLLDSNVIPIRTNSGKLNAPENITLTPTMAVVYWMPPKKVNCVAVTYEVHWKTVTSVNGTQQKSKQIINVPKRVADGRFFAKINLSLPVEDYLIYVYQGKVKNLEKSGTETSVAIKTIRKDASFHEKKKLLKEALLMNRFRHEHILRLLAVCLDGDSPLLVLELMETGDLLTYLKDCRNLQASDSHALRLQDLFAMCEDVARGCCYLEELCFVHRDLACRNCLLPSRNRKDRVIKIGDFGLARDLYKDDYYRMGGEVLLPVRWMAPESLMINIFTSQSDVWSFGVLMWEITSLGEQPYIGKANEAVINYVRVGGRLPITLNCPSALYQLMLRCWSAADARPNFEYCLKNIIALRKNIKDALLSPVDAI
ncbi:Proto-oncogene tyrosine-protein kinase ROS, partial [Camponotus floridanus]